MSSMAWPARVQTWDRRRETKNPHSMHGVEIRDIRLSAKAEIVRNSHSRQTATLSTSHAVFAPRAAILWNHQAHHLPVLFSDFNPPSLLHSNDLAIHTDLPPPLFVLLEIYSQPLNCSILHRFLLNVLAFFIS